jgi:hypothetical protein
MLADKLLDRLQRVQKTGPNKWRACCPAHKSAGRTLAIREDDGRVLVKCFAECEIEAVLSAVGFSFKDLYERPLGEFKPIHRPFRADDVLDVLYHESNTLAILASDFAQKKGLAPLELERIYRVASRVNRLKTLVSGECR